jgi:hypothetical protein
LPRISPPQKNQRWQTVFRAFSKRPTHRPIRVGAEKPRRIAGAQRADENKKQRNLFRSSFAFTIGSLQEDAPSVNKQMRLFLLCNIVFLTIVCR